MDLTGLSIENNQQAKVAMAVNEAIMKSFETDKLRGDNFSKGHGMTHAEIKRRFEICQKWILDLRMNKQFSISRICDTLYRILRGELDGDDISPIINSRIWTP